MRKAILPGLTLPRGLRFVQATVESPSLPWVELGSWARGRNSVTDTLELPVFERHCMVYTQHETWMALRGKAMFVD